MPDVAAATAGVLSSRDGTRLALHAWPNASAAITFAVVHGLGEHGGRYERFARGMAGFGMATYAVDLRGHGHSDGARGHVNSWSQWVEDTAAFVAYVESQAGGGEVIPLGHSFGGCVMLSTVRAGKLPRARRFVLSSPALRLKVRVPGWKSTMAGAVSRIAPSIALDNEVDPRTISRIPEMVAAYRDDPLVHKKISARLFTEWQRAAEENLAHAKDVQLPFLILAGTADGLIDCRGSEELHSATPGTSDLRLLEGRFHEPFNDLGSEEVFASIAEWVRR